MAHARFTQEQAQEMYVALNKIMNHLDPDSTDADNYRADDPEGAMDTAYALAKEALSKADAPAEPITLLTQEQGGHYSALTCEDYDPDEPLEVTITPLGLVGLAELAGIPATWDDGDGATSITAR